MFGTFGDDKMPEPPRKVTGTFDGKTLKLTTGTSRRAVRINGQPAEMAMRTDFMGALDGSGMRGVMLVQVGDHPAPARKCAQSQSTTTCGMSTSRTSPC